MPRSQRGLFGDLQSISYEPYQGSTTYSTSSGGRSSISSSSYTHSSDLSEDYDTQRH
ncbi:hypothetical protein AMATHDRAFT_53465 [Amanita thiersii Skay4041]|uniref:Uncharacterized protein n=1 Tax=Amanita thiersii Skay4041 TaxID=703135 RepID=A0A2A9NWR2_9AGAR|nr:hypothetical protein AMATHDRAFT_53465 [Amanita thiersii Skay4041]